MKKIILTGGGTAGHVTPNLALVPALQEKGYEISYIGSYDGIEKSLITQAGLPYYGISSGKLRRYFDWKNFSDPFRVIKGYGEARKILKKQKPDIVFSKGGFVAVPVVLAAHSLHIPVIIHESDMTPGLANKLCLSSAVKICCNFSETLAYLPAGKAVHTGCPIRKELLSGSRLRGLEMTGFTANKPVLMIIGGSMGAVSINNALRAALPELLPHFQILHLCGKGHLDNSLQNTSGYVQYEYIGEQLKDLFAMADVVISRAGANAICELLALKKPALLIPLGLSASRGDQILNAESYQKKGYSMVLPEEELTPDRLVQDVLSLYENRSAYLTAMEQSPDRDAVDQIVSLIEKNALSK
jgi:UDP-N-acetylglucosamine--N-acetylmuramyl-(pentapeptide) pyrophosphoryl-undecaprenol N-acetylglucosamine transferase